ncbi:glycosyltransferase family 4 protein [Microvirga flavescens]|uniref:glycosyltransferase family 4 protein n=1 Tax=Microvirga flavescens TaxID=2249811 RepID=UPI000DDB5E33|nr:glycosyltransferase family 4 protein [Microvirga flavescens]
MARLFMKALDRAGFSPFLASELRTLDKDGDPPKQAAIRDASEQEADSLIAQYKALPARERPRLWFTYHVYYKAPDWIGPRVADALDIPYVVAEGSRAAKRAQGPWALAHHGAESALDRADAIFVMTDADRVALERARPEGQKLISLPPFLDAQEWDAPSHPARHERAEARLLTVAMMREGDKLASYRILADALTRVSPPWRLDIVGDGEARDTVKNLFSDFGDRVHFHGAVEDRGFLRSLYESADLFLWPAVNEAYGMVLLEAQLFGCPVVAGAYGGVANVVEDGTTGLLTPPGDVDAFAQAVSALLHDNGRRMSLGKAARRFVLESRSLQQAAARLEAGLMPLLSMEGARTCVS